MTYLPPLPPYGPLYPDLGPKVAKLRGMARRDPAKRREHGEAVLEAVRRLNLAALDRVVALPKTNCASGTAHNTGKAILKAVRDQNARRVSSNLQPRSDDRLRELYAQAMAAKSVSMS